MSLDTPAGNFEDLKRIILPVRPKRLHGWALLLGDLLAIVIAWYVANKIFFSVPIYTTYIGEQRIGVIEILSLERLAALIGVLFLFRQSGHYRDHIHYFFQLRGIFVACSLGLIGESLLRLYLERPTSMIGIFLAWGLTLAIIMLLRIVTSDIITKHPRFRQPAVILSSGRLGLHAREAILRKPRLGYREAKDTEIDSEIDWPEIADKAIFQGDRDKLIELQHKADQTPADTLFLFAFDTFDQDTVAAAIKSLKTLNRPFGFVTSQTGIRLPQFKEFPFFGEDLILLLPDQRGPSLPSRFIKRSFDIALSATVLLTLLPLWIALVLLIRRDGGPVFFHQDRIGKDGVHFKCLKFRTMVVDAEAQLADLLARDDEARQLWETHQKIHKDPRITPIGKHLRKGSLDELPQLINVLRGDMSIVGPRPCFDDQVRGYGKRFASYLSVRPGITGLWQVSGRNQTTFEERAELEAWYVDNWSLWLDLFILVKTVPVVLLAKGAH